MEKLLLRTVVVVAAVAATGAAGAAECYKNYRNDDIVAFADDWSFVWNVPGGATIQCTTLDNSLARGPFPGSCDNGSEKFEVEYAFYPDAAGNTGALFWLGGDIWYRQGAC